MSVGVEERNRKKREWEGVSEEIEDFFTIKDLDVFIKIISWLLADKKLMRLIDTFPFSCLPPVLPLLFLLCSPRHTLGTVSPRSFLQWPLPFPVPHTCWANYPPCPFVSRMSWDFWSSATCYINVCLCDFYPLLGCELLRGRGQDLLICVCPIANKC